MAESLIERIQKQTLERIRAEKNRSRKVLLIFMGGDRDVENSLEHLKNLSSLNIEFHAYLTKAAKNIIGEKKVKEYGIDTIVSDIHIWNREILDDIDAVVVPVLTLNGASKIAHMIADCASVNIVLLALRYGKKVIVARDSVVCCGRPELSATSAFMIKVNEIVSTMRSLGIKVTITENMNREIIELLEISEDVNQESKSADAPCGGDIERCKECGLCVINREGDVRLIIEAGADRVSSKLVNSKIKNDFAPIIDHTNLKADVTQEEIGKLCEEAKKYSFATVCVNPSNVKLAKQLLENSRVGVTTVIGFPLGATTSNVKAVEARDATANGADEIDMVINVGALKSGNFKLVEDDIKAVRYSTAGKILKVILETALLNREQIIKACEIARSAGADFVKTSTGFGTGGAKAEDVRLMRETVGPLMGVKASGGIKTDKDIKKMLEAGATRIGASASVAIVTGGESKSEY